MPARSSPSEVGAIIRRSRSPTRNVPAPTATWSCWPPSAPAGTFTRQVFLGDTLDAGHTEPDYTAGVLTLSIPVHEVAKPRKIEIASHDAMQISPGSHPLSPLPQASLSRASGTCPAPGRPADAGSEAVGVLHRLVKRQVRAVGAPKTRIT